MTIRQHFEPGDDMPTAEEWNDILRTGDIPFSRSRPIKVILSGDSSPYSWDELDGDRTGEETAYELNKKEDLGGNNAIIYPATHGHYVFQYRSGGTSGTFTIRIQVTECDSNVGTNRFVTLSNGIVSHTVETDSFGVAIFSGITPGNWTASIPGDISWFTTILGPIVVSGSDISLVMARNPRAGTCARVILVRLFGCLVDVVPGSPTSRLRLDGMTVRATNGVTTYTGVTDSNGEIGFPSSAGTWTITIIDLPTDRVKITGWLSDNSTSVVVSSPNVYLVSGTSEAKPGYHCIFRCKFPVKDTLYYSGLFGNRTFTWNNGVSTWYAMEVGNPGDPDYQPPLELRRVITTGSIPVVYPTIFSLGIGLPSCGSSFTTVSCIPYLTTGFADYCLGNVDNYTISE